MRLIHVRGTGLAVNLADALSLFPGCVSFRERVIEGNEDFEANLIQFGGRGRAFSGYFGPKGRRSAKAAEESADHSG